METKKLLRWSLAKESTFLSDQEQSSLEAMPISSYGQISKQEWKQL
jgi:hypothetical protein